MSTLLQPLNYANPWYSAIKNSCSVASGRNPVDISKEGGCLCSWKEELNKSPLAHASYLQTWFMVEFTNNRARESLFCPLTTACFLPQDMARQEHQEAKNPSLLTVRPSSYAVLESHFMMPAFKVMDITCKSCVLLILAWFPRPPYYRRWRFSTPLFVEY